MRLFISIKINKENSLILDEIIADLQTKSSGSTATLPENHHLTLAFIGESERIDDIIACIDALPAAALPLIVSKLDFFPRPGGDMIILALKPEAALMDMQKRLSEALSAAGFAVEKRKYLPHLTLLRRARMHSGFDFRRYSIALPEIREQAGRISLMKSERLAGVLCYTEIYGRDLSEELPKQKGDF